MGKVNSIAVFLIAVTAAFVAIVAPNTACAAEKAVVKYRLTKQKTVHLDDGKVAKGYDQLLKKLGCESKLGSHSGHYDLTYSCPKWRQAEFDGHAAAHKWQAWLKRLGFETAHKH
jgi:NADH dehydrogenase FAD-containing subunit